MLQQLLWEAWLGVSVSRRCEGGDDGGFGRELFVPAQPQRGTEQKRVSPQPGYPPPPAQDDVQHGCRGQRTVGRVLEPAQEM